MRGRPDSPADGFDSALEAWTAARDPDPNSDCPDANALAAFAGARLLEAEREQIETHLGACRACRTSVAAALRAEASEAGVPHASQRRPAGRSIRWWQVAAAAVVVAGVWILARPRAQPTTDALLQAHADRLARDHPSAFGGFELLSPRERLQRADALERGNSPLGSPLGATLTTRPTFVWTADTAQAAGLRVSTADGRGLARVEDARSPWKWPETLAPLTRGEKYLWEVEFAGVLGPERASRTFRVASDDVAELYEQQVAQIQATVPDPLGKLLLAQVALRHGLLEEARRHAEAYAALRPTDHVGRETLFQVLTRSGDPSAGTRLEGE